MTQYIGVKIVTAVPMAVAATPQYSSMLGHAEGTEGYEVTYESGYKSWSPKAEFESANQPTTNMSFPQALHMMLQGHEIACSHWNTYFMRVKLGAVLKEKPPLAEIGDGSLTEYPAKIDMEYSKAQFELTTEELEVFQDWRPSWHEMQCANWYIWTQEDADARKAAADAA